MTKRLIFLVGAAAALNVTPLLGQGSGSALSFDGIDDYVSIAHSDTLNLADKYSIELYFKPQSIFDATAENDQGIFDQGPFRAYLDATAGSFRFIHHAEGAYSSRFSANLDGNVAALAVYNDELFVGGDFSTVAGEKSLAIAKWDGVGWSDVGTGIEGEVFALKVFNGELYAGGVFDTAGGIQAENIARWDGVSWQPVGGGVSGTVRCMEVFGSYLHVGGGFGTAGGISASRIARWDGRNWSNLGTGLSGTVHALREFAGHLYAGGGFTAAGGQPAARVARWDGAAWSDVGAAMDQRVLALDVYENELYAGGDFTTAGGAETLRIARWDGVQWSNVDGGVNGSVRSLSVYDGDLYLGGLFLVAGGVSVNRIAKWDGVEFASVSTEANFSVDAMTSYQEELIAGGSFSIIGGVRVHGIARWDGNIWRAMHTGLDNAGWCLQVFQDELYVGGEFTQAGGASAKSVAKWTGSQWEGIGADMDDRARAMAVFQEALYVGGEFISAGGKTVNHLARWDGVQWQSVGSGLDGTVLALAVFEDKLLVGGSFANAGGAPAPFLAAWDGQSWLDVGGELDGPISDMQALDGDLYISGSFTHAGALDAPRIVRWDGREFSEVGDGFDDFVESLAVYKNELYAGGAFTLADGATVNHIARWDGTTWQPLGPGLNDFVRGLGVFNNSLYVGGPFTATGDGIGVRAVARWNGQVWSPAGSGADDTVRAFLELDGSLYLTGRFTAVDDVTSPHVAVWEQPVQTVASTRTVWPAEAHHVSIASDGATLRLYVNGLLESTAALSVASGDIVRGPLWIGRTNGPAAEGTVGEFFAGEIDEVRFWSQNRVLSGVRDQMNRKLTGLETGLAAYWRFDEGTGVAVADGTPNGHAGTLFGPSWVASTAPIGDDAVWTALASALSLASPYGDSLELLGFSDNPPFASLIRIDAAPNTIQVGAGLFGILDSHYFEAWVPNGTNTLIDAAYHYQGHPGIVDENVLTLASREDAAAAQWDITPANLDTLNKVLLADNVSLGQFVLAEAGYELEMAADPPGAGITVPPAGTLTRHRAGSLIDLLAEPSPSFVFDQWLTSAGEPVTPDADCPTSAVVTIDADKTVTAQFAAGEVIDSAWVGGTTCPADSGRECWGSEANWCPMLIPNNGPGRSFDVSLDGFAAVTLDLSPTIDALRLNNGALLQVNDASGANVRTLATNETIASEGILRATDRKRLVLDAPVIDQMGICADCDLCAAVGRIEATDGNASAKGERDDEDDEDDGIDGEPKSIVEINGSIVIGGRARTVGDFSEIHLIGGAELEDVCVSGVVVPDGQTGRFRSTLINNDQLTIGGTLLSTQFEPASDGAMLQGVGKVHLTSQALSRLGNFKTSFVNGVGHTIDGAGIVFGSVTNFGFVIAQEPGADLILFPPGMKTNHGGMGARHGGTLRIADDIFGDGQLVALGGAIRLIPGVLVECGEVYLNHDPDGTAESVVRIEELAELRASCTVSLGWNATVALGGCAPPPPPTQPVGPPPLLIVESLGTLDVDGRFELLRDALAVEVQSSATVRLAGDFVNQSRSPELFVWQDGPLTLDGVDQQYESAGEDCGTDDAGFDVNFALHTLELAATTTARIVDVFDNQNDGQAACDEALYVDTLALDPGSTLITDGCHVYYRNLSNNGGTIPGLGDDVLNIPNADYDTDGDVDAADYAAFHTCMIESQTQTCLDRFDADHDQSLGLYDFAFFQAAYPRP